MSSFTLQSQTFYPTWDMRPTVIPERSRLFRIEPIGIGTAAVESMTSYLTRLALEHRVRPSVLLLEVIRPHLKIAHEINRNNISKKLASSIIGVGDITAALVKVMESFTLYDGLGSLTMATWTNVLSPNRLLRPIRAWCPECYEEWRLAGKTIYDPLLWSINAISICPQHEHRLCRICPHCRSKALPFTGYSWPGYCSICKGWLGGENRAELSLNRLLMKNSFEQQTAFVNAIGELLIKATDLQSLPIREEFVRSFVGCADLIIRQTRDTSPKLAVLWAATLRLVLKGSEPSKLEVLLEICYESKISLFNLLLGRIHSADVDRVYRLRAQCLRRYCKGSPRNEQMPWNEVRDELEASLLQHPSPSCGDISHRTRRPRSHLKRKYLELYVQILNRYYKPRGIPANANAALHKLEAARAEETPTKAASILNRLAPDLKSYCYDYNPELCEAIEIRDKTIRNKTLDLEELHTQLKAALVEQPPPAFTEVARRLRRGDKLLRDRFPVLSRLIIDRYTIWRRHNS